ncbi:recombinase family protein [Streptomyces sp. NPDC048417]|uniref:recombinase family protein n=1 Tax=Streptomyces sp. NPDC048417 TaxID=3155387 RepID=UPI0034462072
MPRVDPREAKLIREAADAVLARAADPETGATLTGICRAWNTRGITSPRGKPWVIQTLRSVLLSPRIAGRVAHKGEDVGPAQRDAIVDHDTWLALRTVLTDPARSAHLASADARAPKYLGAGLYRCGRPGCGERHPDRLGHGHVAGDLPHVAGPAPATGRPGGRVLGTGRGGESSAARDVPY